MLGQRDHVKKPWRRKAVAAGAAVAGLALAISGPVSQASASARGITTANSGPTVSVKGQSVTIPYGIVGVAVDGDGLHVEKVTVFYEGQQASNLRARWFAVDSHGKEYLDSEEYDDSGTEAQIVYSRYEDVNADMPDSGKICGQIFVQDALAGTACVNLFSGTNWTFWD
jgi:hypothetical protein